MIQRCIFPINRAPAFSLFEVNENSLRITSHALLSKMRGARYSSASNLYESKLRSESTEAHCFEVK